MKIKTKITDEMNINKLPASIKGVVAFMFAVLTALTIYWCFVVSDILNT